MKKVAIVLLLLPLGCATVQRDALEYDKSEKIMVGTMLGLQAMDCYQTHKLTNGDDWIEGNPLINGTFGDTVDWHEAALFKTILIAPVYYPFVHKAKTHEQRKTMLRILNAISFVPVVHNEVVSGGVVFDF